MVGGRGGDRKGIRLVEWMKYRGDEEISGSGKLEVGRGERIVGRKGEERGAGGGGWSWGRMKVRGPLQRTLLVRRRLADKNGGIRT